MVALKNTVLCNKPMPSYRESTIPLNLFQTWHTNELPPGMYECVQALKEANPEFTHHFFNDDMCREFIKVHFDDNVLHTYDKLKPGAYKADLWRYCVLYVHGGIYLDIKYRCVAPFKLIELTTKEHFVRDRDYGDNPGVYQAMLVCYPKNPILLQCIHKIVEYTRQLEYGATVLFLGPLLVASFFNRSEMQTWDMKYTGLQIVRQENPILEMYTDYYQEVNKTAIRTYYMDSWCNRDIYTLPSLSSKKTHVLTRSISYQNSLLFVHSPIWIDQGTERTLCYQWGSYVSREDGTFSGVREGLMTKGTMTTDTFAGADSTVCVPMVTQVSLHATDGIQYTYSTRDGLFSGPDMDTAPPLTPCVDVMVHGMGSSITLDQPCFIYRWFPMLVLLPSTQVHAISYHTPSFFKECTSSVPCIRREDKYCSVLTKCIQYELDGIPRKKYAHFFVVLDMYLNVVKYSEFFILENSSVSIISDFHIQDTKWTLGFTVSNNICMICDYDESDILALHWT